MTTQPRSDRAEMCTEPAVLVDADLEAEAPVLARLRGGDETAFEDLVRTHGPQMLATIRRFLPREHDAHDALQDAFLSAFKSVHRFAGTAKLSTWLHRIAVNAALMKLRSRRRKREESIEELLPCFDERGAWVREPAAWDTPGHEMMEQRETRAMVRRCIEQLPESYRVVLLLRDIEELDTTEVADLLDLTPNAVKIRLHRARQALRTLIEREHADAAPSAWELMDAAVA